MEKKKGSDINEAQRQVAYADKILINKIDLATEEEIQELEYHLSTINPMAEIIRCSFSAVPLERILAINAFDASRLSLPDAEDTHKHEDDVQSIGYCYMAEQSSSLLQHLSVWFH